MWNRLCSKGQTDPAPGEEHGGSGRPTQQVRCTLAGSRGPKGTRTTSRFAPLPSHSLWASASPLNWASPAAWPAAGVKPRAPALTLQAVLLPPLQALLQGLSRDGAGGVTSSPWSPGFLLLQGCVPAQSPRSGRVGAAWELGQGPAEACRLWQGSLPHRQGTQPPPRQPFNKLNP